jgi:hypothetical protein
MNLIEQAPSRVTAADDATGVEWLARCLALAPSSDDTMRLRSVLFSDAAVWERLFEAASSRRLMPALAMRLRQRGLVPPLPRRHAPNPLTPAAILEAHWTQHLGIRARQAESLCSIVGVLNRIDIEPILLKGACCAWLDQDPWRTMRDFDILVPGARASEANAALKAERYLPLPDAKDRPNRHHFELLFRSDLPGWVEIHRRAGNPYAEQFLRTAEIAARSVPAAHPQAQARLMPASDHIWHGLVHHHFGHSAFARGTVDLKGLFEFAVAVAALPGDEVDTLVGLASRDAAGLAAFDLWIAAAVDLLAMPLPVGHSLVQDAVTAWGRIKQRHLGQQAEPKYRGYGRSIALGWSAERIKRVRPRPAFGALGARWKVLNRLLPKLRRD